MSPFISIIIPCYNVELYLERCLDSVLMQRYTDYEIIVVNDASTDETLRILSRYKKNYPQVSIINLKENVGLGRVRDIALERVNGKYVIFVDSDDFIHPDALSICGRVIEKYNPDLIEYSYKIVQSNEITEIGDVNPEWIEGRANILNKCDNIACNKIFRIDIIKENQLQFKYRLFEDTHFTTEYILNCSTAVKIDTPLYNYYINYKSLSHTFRRDYFLIMAERTYEVWCLLNDSNLHEEAKNYLKSSLTFLFNKLLCVRGQSKFDVPESYPEIRYMNKLIEARNRGMIPFVLTSFRFVSISHVIKSIVKIVLSKK